MPKAVFFHKATKEDDKRRQQYVDIYRQGPPIIGAVLASDNGFRFAFCLGTQCYKICLESLKCTEVK